MTQAQTGPGPTLVVLAAGASRRYGGLKQLEPLGPTGEALLDYALFDAARAGFSDAVLVVREELEAAFVGHFRDYPPALPVRYAYQQTPEVELGGSVVPGGSARSGRTKPLGTAQAVLAARRQVARAFAVVNADDFYGARAYRVAAGFLAGVDDRSAHFAIVGYPLDQTLSPSGGVSRAVCRTDASGALAAITEVLDIRRTGGGIRGVRVDGRPVELLGGEEVSMNFWAFTPRVFEALEVALAAFLACHGGDPEAELHLPTVVGDAVARGAARVDVIPAGSRTFGVTFPADRPAVASALSQGVARGDYPASLASDVQAADAQASDAQASDAQSAGAQASDARSAQGGGHPSTASEHRCS